MTAIEQAAAAYAEHGAAGQHALIDQRALLRQYRAARRFFDMIASDRITALVDGMFGDGITLHTHSSVLLLSRLK